MGAQTKIQWADHSWSPWRGCINATLPSGTGHPGCDHCYAETLSKRNPAVLGVWGSQEEGGRRVVAAPRAWGQLATWNDAAQRAGHMATVFPSLCDPFEEWEGPMHDHNGNRIVPNMNDFRETLGQYMDYYPWLFWLLLTKRPALAKGSVLAGHSNSALIVSVSDQHSADLLIPDLVRVSQSEFPLIGVSYEPALGPVSFARWLPPKTGPVPGVRYLDLIIIGGESGAGARPFDLRWAADVLRESMEWEGPGRVSIFVKQLGALAVNNGMPFRTRDSKGGDWNEWPRWLMVRETPDYVNGPARPTSVEHELVDLGRSEAGPLPTELEGLTIRHEFDPGVTFPPREAT